MSLIFRFFIHLYWKIIPAEKRAICLYKESCSKYVYRKFKNKGFFGGIKAISYRFKNCNNKYKIFNKNGICYIKTSAGLIIKEDNMSEKVLKSIK
jgi:uncharacterized protein